MIHRREWLKHSAAAATLFGVGQRAAATALAPGDYKALVCVFLFGGNDGNNLVVPIGDGQADYARVRGPSGLAIAPEQLVPLPAADGSVSHGLHPALRPLEPLWAAGRLALLFNTGTLVEPITRAGYLKAAARPDHLFSHADQQEFAQALAAPGGGSNTGWGFRLAREAGFGGPRLPNLVSLSGNPRFLQGDVRRALVLPARGGFGLAGGGAGPVAAARMAAFRTMWAGNATPIGAQAGAIVDSALAAAAFVDPILVGATPASSEPFAALKSDIAQQLQRVARLIEAREAIGNPRQVFFVSMGGYDTHVNQRADQDRLLGELAAALKAFHDTTEALGIADRVTSFTMSDFARTLKVNTGGGTDHGWGSHQLVLGGAVHGRRSYGTFPTLALGGPDDAGNEGRWIPTTAYEQVVATLARWFGIGADGLREVLPNLARFEPADLGFMA